MKTLKKDEKGFGNTYKFSGHDINKFILLFGKGVYPCEYMDDWEKFSETSLPGKGGFYSHLNIENITDVNYIHTKRICKHFEIKNVGEYRDLYIQSNPLLLADVFENFWNMCLEIYELSPACFLTAPVLA